MLILVFGVCVCVCVYVCVCVSECTSVSWSVCVGACVREKVFICMFILRLCRCKHILHEDSGVSVCLRVCMAVCLCLYLMRCVYVCVCACEREPLCTFLFDLISMREWCAC